MDVVDAQMQAFRWLFSQAQAFGTFNIGRGEAVTVKQMADKFAEISGQPITTNPQPRRPHDVASLVADMSHTQNVLQWQPSRSLEDMIKDTWAFYKALN
jgi:UDP-glucose 4-epimerase